MPENPNANPAGQEVTPTEGGEVTFTQAQVDALVAKEKAKAIAKATKGMPSEEDMTAFRAWKESQQTEKEKWDAVQKERDESKAALTAAQAELEQFKREKFLLGKGIKPDDVDYYAFKIGKLVTEEMTFEKAAEEFLKEHEPPKKDEGTMKVALGAPLGGKSSPMSKEDIYKIKDPTERQNAIAEHINLFRKED